MNLPSEALTVDSINIFRADKTSVAPFEFRLLTADDTHETLRRADGDTSNGAHGSGPGTEDRSVRTSHDRAGREAILRSAVEAARQEGFQDGEREGRRAARADADAELNALVGQEREQVATTLRRFRGARDRYFAEVEQEVVKLALAIAARVLHREAQMDPLLLSGAVRVALEKMADRSGVVLRVAGADVELWERSLLVMQPHERPRVEEDLRLERGECVLETAMGTVELGVKVQLQEIEKGFFDLLNHRPTE
jgi:flagellar assembly protein FliH